MTKTIKRIVSVIVTVVMIMAMGTVAFAADPNPVVTITKNDTNDKAAHTYEFYQVFSAKVDTDEKFYDIAWGSGVNDTAANFYTDLQAVEGFSTCTDATSVLAVLEGKDNNSAIVDRFAKFISTHTTSTKVSAALAADATSTTATLTSGLGYYFVKDTITSSEDAAISKFMLAVVNKATTITITSKEAVPTLDKNIIEGSTPVKQNQASVGDVITFELSSKVPDLTNKGYNGYWFVMNDTLSDGLTFIGISSVTVGATTLTAGTGYTLTEPTDSSNSFKVVFNDFLNYGLSTTYIGTDIKVTYTAMLNEKADITEAGNLNTGNLVYSNDPSKDYSGKNEPTTPGDETITGHSPDAQTVTYTTGAKIIKVDKNNPTKTLVGAEFHIEGTSSKKVIVTKTEYEASASGTFYKLKDGTYTDVEPTAATEGQYDNPAIKYAPVTRDAYIESGIDEVDKTITVDDTGCITLTGLGAGHYTFVERKAPTGYTIDGVTHTLDITCVFDSNNKPVWTYTVDNGTATTIATGSLVEITVKNSKTSSLPETGGIGTTGFYIAGATLIAAGAALIVLKKKVGSEKA